MKNIAISIRVDRRLNASLAVDDKSQCVLTLTKARVGTGSRVIESLGHRVSDFDRVGSGHGSVCQIGV